MTILSKPHVEFNIPSIHDELELQCRVHIPYSRPALPSSPPNVRGLAVFAHPYAPLGGCYDDPVVSRIGTELLRTRFILITFNFRGAEGSPGKTTWTGKAELNDYITVYAYAMLLLRNENLVQYFETNTRNRVMILLGGYSYGSMMCVHLPTSEMITDYLYDYSDNFDNAQIDVLAGKLIEGLKKPYDTADGSPKAIQSSSRSIGELQIETAYLIVSPLVGVIAGFLTMFSQISFTSRDNVEGSLHKHSSLIIYGTADRFIRLSKIRDWHNRFTRRPGSKCVVKEIEDASHFWREELEQRVLIGEINAWLTKI